MSRNQNRKVILLIGYIVIVTCLIVVLSRILLEKHTPVIADCPSPSLDVVSSESTIATTPSSSEALISDGGKTLVEKESIRTEHLDVTDEDTIFKDEKEKGVNKFFSGNFKGAIMHFKNAHQEYKNAPETMIYLNNARIEMEKLKKKLEVYTIAVVAPIGSSDARDSALEILRGVAQAQDEINNDSEDIKGVRLKVVIANDSNKKDHAIQIANTLADDPEVLGVVGHFSSEVTQAAGNTYKKKELVAISPTSTAVGLSDYKYIFRTTPSDRDAAAKLVEYILPKLQKEKKAAIFFNCQNTYSKSLAGEFDKAIKSKGVSVLHIKSDLSDPDFKADESVQQAFNQGAGVLMLAPDSKVDRETLLQVVSAAKKNNLRLLGGDDLYGCKILERYGEETAEGMVVAIPWHIEKNRHLLFVKNSNLLWGNVDVNWRTALAYDATRALAAAIKRNPKRENIRPNLLSIKVDPNTTASGPIVFLSETGDRSSAPVQLVEIRRTKGACPNTEDNFEPI